MFHIDWYWYISTMPTGRTTPERYHVSGSFGRHPCGARCRRWLPEILFRQRLVNDHVAVAHDMVVPLGRTLEVVLLQAHRIGHLLPPLQHTLEAIKRESAGLVFLLRLDVERPPDRTVSAFPITHRASHVNEHSPMLDTSSIIWHGRRRTILRKGPSASGRRIYSRRDGPVPGVRHPGYAVEHAYLTQAAYAFGVPLSAFRRLGA